MADDRKLTCLAIGDPHFKVTNVPETEELIAKVLKAVETIEPDFVVLLGDILDSHERYHVTPLNNAVRFIKSLAEILPTFVLIGNHDYCFSAETPILLQSGASCRADNVTVGAQLAGDNGMPRTVKRLISGKSKMYTIVQDSGISYTVTENHTLILQVCKKVTGNTVQWLKYVEHDDQKLLMIKTAELETPKQANEFIIPRLDILEVTVNEYFEFKPEIREFLCGVIQTPDGKTITSPIKIAPSDETHYFGWETDGNHRFLLADGTIVHNCNNQQFLSDAHAFNAFKGYPNVTICDKPTVWQNNGCKFVFCPYVPPERFEEALNTLEEDWIDADCIFAHQEFYGCRFNPTMTSEQGDIWPDEYPLVVSGHIHDEQRLQSNIYYTGSSIQHGFSENGVKRIALLTFRPNRKFSLKKLDLALKKKKIVYKNIEEVDDYTPDANCIIKLVVKGTQEQFKVFRRGPKYKALEAAGIKISFAPISETIDTGDRQYASQQLSVLEILKDLIKDDDKYVQAAFEAL